MAGQSERDRVLKNIQKQDLEDMLKQGGTVPRENVIGIQQAVGAKQGPSFLGRVWENIKDLKPPEMPDVDWKKIRDFFKTKNLGDEINKTKKKLNG